VVLSCNLVVTAIGRLRQCGDRGEGCVDRAEEPHSGWRLNICGALRRLELGRRGPSMVGENAGELGLKLGQDGLGADGRREGLCDVDRAVPLSRGTWRSNHDGWVVLKVDLDLCASPERTLGVACL
jgi:hypothetical protein